MRKPELEAEPFRYIAGQDMQVRRLQAIVDQVIKGEVPGRKPLILISGPAGMGKTSMAIQTAYALDAALKERTPDGFMEYANERRFFGRRKSYVDFLAEGYKEVRTEAAHRESKRGVLLVDAMDTMMTQLPQPITSELMVARMIEWSEDPSCNVLVIATAYNKFALDDQVLSRFSRQIDLQMPDRNTVMDILTKGAERLGLVVGQPNILGDMQGSQRLVARMVEYRWTTRNINDFLRESYGLRNRQLPWQPMDVQFLESLMPPTPPRIGFAHP